MQFGWFTGAPVAEGGWHGGSEAEAKGHSCKLGDLGVPAQLPHDHRGAKFDSSSVSPPEAPAATPKFSFGWLRGAPGAEGGGTEAVKPKPRATPASWTTSDATSLACIDHESVIEKLQHPVRTRKLSIRVSPLNVRLWLGGSEIPLPIGLISRYTNASKILFCFMRAYVATDS